MPYPGFFLPLSVLIVGFILRGIRLARVKKKQEEEEDYNRSIRNFVIQHEYVGRIPSFGIAPFCASRIKTTTRFTTS